MCGICGIYGKTDPKQLEAMVAAITHRGPDDRGVFTDGCAGLGMARLAILDLSPAGHQPMSNADESVWIVFNGEVYNFQAEREILEAKGHTFQSNGDTEVVIAMYTHYGDDFLLRLRGMFALAIYDRRGGRERLLLARDHLGIKPLLYAEVDGRLVFGSELKALLASGLVRREIDPAALRQLLTFGAVYQPRTMLADVRALLPAHRMIVENGTSRVERYWSLGVDRTPDLRHLPYEDQVEALREALEESVRLQMISDRPLGAFLSGGVDSSLLVALMARHAGKRLKTYSVGYEQEGADIDESADAYRTADYLGTDHSAVIVRGDMVRDRIRAIARGLDQPTVDGVNSYFVSLAASQGVTVAISGTGGDELFTGYPWFRQMVVAAEEDSQAPLRSLLHRVGGGMARQPALNTMALGERAAALETWRSRGSFVAQYGTNYQIFGVSGAAHLLHPALRESAAAGQAIQHDIQSMDELPYGSAIERTSALVLRGYTANQLLRDIDAASMAHGLEVRVPYLDPVIADIALSLPDRSKLAHLEALATATHATSYRTMGTKRILIDIGMELLPPGFDDQPKRGFAMPFDAWLKGPLREVLTETLSETRTKARGWLNPAQVNQVRDGYFEGRYGWPHPWLLMMLELWAQEVLDA